MLRSPCGCGLALSTSPTTTCHCQKTTKPAGIRHSHVASCCAHHRKIGCKLRLVRNLGIQFHQLTHNLFSSHSPALGFRPWDYPFASTNFDCRTKAAATCYHPSRNGFLSVWAKAQKDDRRGKTTKNSFLIYCK